MENTSVKETENMQRDEKIISKKPLFSDNFNKKLRSLSKRILAKAILSLDAFHEHEADEEDDDAGR